MSGIWGKIGFYKTARLVVDAISQAKMAHDGGVRIDSQAASLATSDYFRRFRSYFMED